MHSAPWTNTSISMGLSLVMAAISARLSSRARMARSKPISASCRTPDRVWTVSWVEPWRARPGAICRARAAVARSCTMRASTPASAAMRMVPARRPSSPEKAVVFTAAWTRTSRAWQKATASFSCCASKLPAVRRALNCLRPRYTAFAPAKTAARRASPSPAGASTSTERRRPYFFARRAAWTGSGCPVMRGSPAGAALPSAGAPPRGGPARRPVWPWRRPPDSP